jgi:hypothetical protein
MPKAEAVIRKMIDVIQSNLGKATIGLFAGIVCFAWPAPVAYIVGSVCLYYSIHQFRPVAVWIYQDIRADLNSEFAADEEVADEPTADEPTQNVA